MQYVQSESYANAQCSMNSDRSTVQKAKSKYLAKLINPIRGLIFGFTIFSLFLSEQRDVIKFRLPCVKRQQD